MQSEEDDAQHYGQELSGELGVVNQVITPEPRHHRVQRVRHQDIDGEDSHVRQQGIGYFGVGAGDAEEGDDRVTQQEDSADEEAPAYR